MEGNVLLFVPWGFLVAVELFRRGFGYVTAVMAGMCSGAFLSASVEIANCSFLRECIIY